MEMVSCTFVYIVCTHDCCIGLESCITEIFQQWAELGSVLARARVIIWMARNMVLLASQHNVEELAIQFLALC